MSPNENSSRLEWNENKRTEYEEKFQQLTREAHENNEAYRIPMERVMISEETVRKQVEKMKHNKAPGPDEIKSEVYKAIIQEPIILTHIARAYNNTIETGMVPDQWNTSRTILIEKKKKPRPGDLRPIALTNCGYKIFMGIW